MDKGAMADRNMYEGRKVAEGMMRQEQQNGFNVINIANVIYHE